MAAYVPLDCDETLPNGFIKDARNASLSSTKTIILKISKLSQRGVIAFQAVVFPVMQLFGSLACSTTIESRTLNNSIAPPSKSGIVLLYDELQNWTKFQNEEKKV